MDHALAGEYRPPSPRGAPADELARVLPAIASGPALRLLGALARGPATAGRLAIASGIYSHATARVLLKLRLAGLVEAERDGRRTTYRLRRERAEGLVAGLAELLGVEREPRPPPR
jgi:DNA-binding transcriptional ArsR family regulator